MTKRLEKKMYFFVMGNISGEQKGIQAGHCVEEYGDLYHDTIEYKEYRKDKTYVVLNGGDSNNIGETRDGETYYGSMESHLDYLREANIKHAVFYESSLNNATSAICFICDERVYKYDEYPEFRDWYLTQNPSLHPDRKQDFLRTKKVNYPIRYEKQYGQWLEFIGGEENRLKRLLIKGKRLA